MDLRQEKLNLVVMGNMVPARAPGASALRATVIGTTAAAEGRDVEM